MHLHIGTHGHALQPHPRRPAVQDADRGVGAAERVGGRADPPLDRRGVLARRAATCSRRGTERVGVAAAGRRGGGATAGGPPTPPTAYPPHACPGPAPPPRGPPPAAPPRA